MHRESSISFLIVFGSLSLLVACSQIGNDGGSLGGSGGAGGSQTSCTDWTGKTYAVGQSSYDGCNTCTCTAKGLSCTLKLCVGTGGATGTGGISGSGGSTGTPPIDAGVSEAGQPVASKCGNCGADELCVAYYDGVCTPMGSSCNKVSAATRDAILISHQRCFSLPMGDEICGTRNGQHFWGCGGPACASEPTLSDINCYGP